MQLPTLSDIEAARVRIAGKARLTPLIGNETIDARLGGRVLFKCETLQRMGAFKIRGAYNAIANLDRGRRVGITTKKFLVHASDPRDPIAVGLADVTRAMFDQLDGFDSAVYSMLSANGPGYSLMEPIYREGTLRFTWEKSTQTLTGLHPRELRWIHQRHLYFGWDTDEPHLDLGSDGKLPLAEAPHKLFLYQTIGDGIASARGFMRPATWLHVLGQSSLVSGGIFLRRFGIPPIAAFVPQAKWKDAAFQAEVLAHLQNWGNGDPAVFPDWMRDAFRVDPTAVTTGASNLHMQWRGFIDACLAKCIQGAILQSEASGGGPGSYALGTVHEARSYDVSVVDSIGSCERLRNGVVRAWIDLNKRALAKIFGVTPEDLLWRLPLLSRRIDRETSPKQRAEILCMFADRGMVGSINQARNEYAFDAPVDNNDRFEGKPIALSQAGATVSPSTANDGYEKPAPTKETP